MKSEKCKQCGEHHNGEYGSGRFCSAVCARTFSRSVDKGVNDTKKAVCKTCGKEILINKRACATYTNCPECTKTRPKELNGKTKCTICGKYFSTDRKRTCSQECAEEASDRYKKNRVEWVVEWRRRLKLKAAESKGGKCIICGYKKSMRALDFHHIDSTIKDFGISSGTTIRSLERVKKELEKCVLLCRNCHAEVHDGLISKETLILKEKQRTLS